MVQGRRVASDRRATDAEFLAYFYGDHIGRVCFVIDRPRAAAAPA